MKDLNSKDPADLRDAIFDNMRNAVSNYLFEITERARREQPALYAIGNVALKSGESYTNVTIKIFESGFQIRTTINRISDETEQILLDQVDGVARVVQ